MTILEALKRVKQSKGMIIIRNPIKKGKKPISFISF
jgi:hypothetical protein